MSWVRFLAGTSFFGFFFKLREVWCGWLGIGFSPGRPGFESVLCLLEFFLLKLTIYPVVNTQTQTRTHSHSTKIHEPIHRLISAQTQTHKDHFQMGLSLPIHTLDFVFSPSLFTTQFCLKVYSLGAGGIIMPISKQNCTQFIMSV